MPRGQKNKITYADSPQFKNMGVRMISSGKGQGRRTTRTTRTTAKDMPGSGMAKKAAKAVQNRSKNIDKKVNKATGYK